ncbi:MAG: acylphosphatase, partial [Thermoplasmatales archaeon]|nr:acylphosphatase [Thermoplasmatales archaeon]
MIKAVLAVTGDVQGAGYRSYLIRVARKLGLEGYVENLPNGVVNVVCEGQKEKIEEFVSKIKIKNEVVEVENINVKYDKPTGEFKGKGFIIKVEESFKGLIQEMFQGYATS